MMPTDPDRPTVGHLLARAGTALQALGATGEEVADEWQYVTDLVAVYRGRFAQVASTRGTEGVTPAVAGAIAAAVEESVLVTDPHRAIDWLSTLPQVVLFALGESA
jgi:hypothetical protein